MTNQATYTNKLTDPTNIEVAFDDLSHPNGPALALVATREDIDH
jgi:hypothetical protein